MNYLLCIHYYLVLVLKNVSKGYGKESVLKNVSFSVNPKEFVCVTGPSGAGKSTLMHMMIGAEEPTKGKLEVDGVDLYSLPPTILQLYRRRIGVAFQDYKLLWNRTVYENIAFPLEVCGIPDDQIEKRVKQVLKEMELTKQQNTLTKALSGGEKARTTIARAYVHDPMILFADEPTGNLDPDQSAVVVELLEHIHKKGTTIVLATHEVDIVDALQTRVLRLEDGELTRDSVGGYNKEKRSQPKPTKGSSYDIFEDEQGKKIKITPIG